MSYQLLTQHDAAAFMRGREGANIKYIVVHHWDDPAKKPTFEGVLAWFKNPAAGTSAHYVVEAGRVACMVAESDTAYHAGNWYMNTHSIGIECNPRCSTEDLATVRELVQELKQRYPGARVIGHRDVIPTGCPGAYQSHLDYISGRDAKPAAPGTPQLNVDGWVGRNTVRRWQQLIGTPADGVISSQWEGNAQYLPAFVDCVEWSGAPDGSTFVAALQKRLGIESDGIIGAETVKAVQKHLGVAVDGYFGHQTAKALQNRLNQGKF